MDKKEKRVKERMKEEKTMKEWQEGRKRKRVRKKKSLS